VSEAKPYDIPKQLIWEAYQRVKANRGATGVDGVSLAMFEQNLRGNLYKVWNRMSSGSYHPPPVRKCKPRLRRPPLNESDIPNYQIVGVMHSDERRRMEKPVLRQFEHHLVKVIG
jgi:hypothetical protein